MDVKNVEILRPEPSSSGTARIVEVARDASVSLVEDDGLLEILARVPEGADLPEELLGAAAEILTWLGVCDTMKDTSDS